MDLLKFIEIKAFLKTNKFVGVIDYNFLCFREAINQVFELRSKQQKLADSLDDEPDESDFKQTLDSSSERRVDIGPK